jgi:shikimate dehydrogenase
LRAFGLIGWPLGHSFSKKYFSEKFSLEGISDAQYDLYPLASITDLPDLLRQNPGIKGLNVTIPYKESVIPFLTELDETARAVGAVNCIKIQTSGQLIGYNTDIIGFDLCLNGLPALMQRPNQPTKAYILGTGGAAKAVAYVLQKRRIPFLFVSRNPQETNQIGYDALLNSDFTSGIIVNCTPLGTFPNTAEIPPIPPEIMKPGILVFDLVYNPSETLLLCQAKAQGCFVQNGLEMLHLQADAAWKIWQT